MKQGKWLDQKRTNWKIYKRHGRWYLFLASDFYGWLEASDEKAVDFFARKEKQFPGIVFSPKTWIMTPRKRVNELVEQMKKSGY